MRRVWMYTAVLCAAIAGCAQTSHRRDPVRATTVKADYRVSETSDVRLASFDEATQSESEPALESIPPEPTSIRLQPDVLSLIDLEQIAVRSNPTLRQAQARVNAARGRWVQGGLRPNPVIGFSGSEIGNEGAAGQHGMFVGHCARRSSTPGRSHVPCFWWLCSP